MSDENAATNREAVNPRNGDGGADAVVLTGAEIVCECLLHEGVDIVFGYPGGAILPTYDALTRYPQLHHVLTRHEQGASHMADGYARATGKVGVAMATSGPGATNLVTGIATAMMDSSPIVCITGQVPTGAIGSDAFQETDVTGITLPITKHNYLVTSIDELPEVMREAFHIARTGRPGPVLVDIPKDVQIQEAEFVYPTEPIQLAGYSPPKTARARQVAAALELIRDSKRPIILAGHGISMAGANRELAQLAEKAQIPIALTLLGKGAISEHHPLCLGMMGMHGGAEVNHAIQQADLLIAVGARFDDRVTGKLSEFSPRARVIHIDIDPTSIKKNVHAHIPIVGDVKTVLRELVGVLSSMDGNPASVKAQRKPWQKQVSEWSARHPLAYQQEGKKETKPQYVIEKAYELTKHKAIVVTAPRNVPFQLEIDSAPVFAGRHHQRLCGFSAIARPIRIGLDNTRGRDRIASTEAGHQYADSGGRSGGCAGFMGLAGSMAARFHGQRFPDDAACRFVSLLARRLPGCETAGPGRKTVPKLEMVGICADDSDVGLLVFYRAGRQVRPLYLLGLRRACRHEGGIGLALDRLESTCHCAAIGNSVLPGLRCILNNQERRKFSARWTQRWIPC